MHKSEKGAENMEYGLTKDAQRALAVIYQTYLKRLNAGMKKPGAIFFDSYPGNEEGGRTGRTLRELSAANYLSADPLGSFLLTDKGIAFMERL